LFVNTRAEEQTRETESAFVVRQRKQREEDTHLLLFIYNIYHTLYVEIWNSKRMTMITKRKTNSKFTKAASLAASLALVLNGGVKFASANYDEQSIVCEHKTASISCPTGELISVVDGWYVFSYI
jgi:hypothetical protein